MGASSHGHSSNASSSCPCDWTRVYIQDTRFHPYATTCDSWMTTVRRKRVHKSRTFFRDTTNSLEEGANKVLTFPNKCSLPQKVHFNQMRWDSSYHFSGLPGHNNQWRLTLVRSADNLTQFPRWNPNLMAARAKFDTKHIQVRLNRAGVWRGHNSRLERVVEK